MALLQSSPLRLLSPASLRSQISFSKNARAYSSHFEDSQAAEFEKAREWYRSFRKSTIPVKIATTKYSKASGSGGQKTNKTDSKATTVWPLHALLPLIPKSLHQGIRDSRYYAVSSNSITIQCDAHRSRTQNKDETHDRLFGEMEKIYKDTVPGITSLETMKKIEQLKKCENEVRLKFKKMQGDKKRARSGGGGRHGD